jgi:hypothetical protein
MPSGTAISNPGFFAMFATRRQQNRIAQVVRSAEPQTVVKAFHRFALADIDVVILRRRNAVCTASIKRQGGDRQRLVALTLVNAEEPDRRGREQPVNRRLHIGAHMTGELARGRDQLVLGAAILRDAAKRPLLRMT